MDTVTCPACGQDVEVVDEHLVEHEWTPDNATEPERCRWSGEPVWLIVG
jgi:hypothetical protein